MTWIVKWASKLFFFTGLLGGVEFLLQSMGRSLTVIPVFNIYPGAVFLVFGLGVLTTIIRGKLGK